MSHGGGSRGRRIQLDLLPQQVCRRANGSYGGRTCHEFPAGVSHDFRADLYNLYGNAVIKEVLPDSAAAASGLEVGDRIQKIDGKTIHIYDELQYTLQSNHGESLTLDVVDATGTHHKYKLQPKLDEKQGRYLIGFSPEVKTGLFAESVDGYAKMGIAETARYSLFAMINYVK